jgi:hypothetical protein
MDPDPDSGGPKIRGSGFGSGSATLLFIILPVNRLWYCSSLEKKTSKCEKEVLMMFFVDLIRFK